MLEAKVKDQGHKRKCSPKKQTKKKVFTKIFQAISKKQKTKKKVFTKIFQAISTKNVFQKIFQALHKILTIQKILLSSSRGQANFRGLEASRPWTWPSRPRPRTSKCVFEDVPEAKDVLEDSTSGSSLGSFQNTHLDIGTCQNLEHKINTSRYLYTY